MKFVLLYPLQFVGNICHSRKCARYGQKCILFSTPKYPSFSSECNETSLSRQFEKHLNSSKIRPVGPRFCLSGQAGGWRTDRHDEAVAFRDLANAPKNLSPYYLRCHIGCSVPSNGMADVRFPVQTDSILVHRMSVIIY